MQAKADEHLQEGDTLNFIQREMTGEENHLNH